MIYLTRRLSYDDDVATIIYHLFLMNLNIASMVGAIVADSWLGKYKTALYSLVIFGIGIALLTGAAIPVFRISHRLICTLSI